MQGVYINMDINEEKSKQEESLLKAEYLYQTTQTIGWKIIKDMADKIAKPDRLRIKGDMIDGISLHKITYVAGQIEAFEVLFKQIDSALRQRDKILKQKKQPNTPPL